MYAPRAETAGEAKEEVLAIPRQSDPSLRGTQEFMLPSHPFPVKPATRLGPIPWCGTEPIKPGIKTA